MRPAAAVGADHVGAVADRAEDEAVGLGLDDLLVADADGQPVAGGLPDLEGELLAALAALHSRLHDGELVPRDLVGLDRVLADQLDVGVLGLLGELVARRVPDPQVVDQLQDVLLVLRQPPVGLLHAQVDRLADVLARVLQGSDEVGLREVGVLVLRLAGDGRHELLEGELELFEALGVGGALDGLLNEQVAVSVLDDDLLDDGVVIPLQGEFDVAERGDDVPAVLLELLREGGRT